MRWFRQALTVAVLAAALGAGLAPAAPPPEPAAPPSRPPAPSAPPRDSGLTEQVKVELVQFNILATDKKGRPIGDLRPEDLEVKDHGVPQTIAFMEPYLPPAPAAESAAGGKPKAGAAPAPMASSPAPGAQRGRWLALFFDEDNSSIRTRNKAVQSAQDFVEHGLDPADRVAVVSLAGKLSIVQSFTRNRDALRQALGQVLVASQYAVQDRASALDDLVQTMGQCPETAPDLCARRVWEMWRDENVRRTDACLKALTTVIRSLAPIPDIKVLVMFSDGVPQDPSQEATDAATIALGSAVGDRMTVADAAGLQARAYARIAEAAASARVSIFTINPGGAHHLSAISARQARPLDEKTNPLQLDIYRRSERNLEAGLVELSERTGGTSTMNADPLVGLRTAADAARGLYTIGFHPRELGEAVASHELKVRVKRRGVEVQYARDVPRRLLTRALPGELQVETGDCSPDGRRPLRIGLRIERRGLLFEEVKDQLVSNFSMLITVLLDGKTEPDYFDYRIFNISNTPEEVRAGGLPDPAVEEKIMAPCRPFTVTAVATDTATGAAGTFTTRKE